MNAPKCPCLRTAICLAGVLSATVSIPALTTDNFQLLSQLGTGNFEAIAVEGNTLYLAKDDNILVAVGMTDPGAPVELSRLPIHDRARAVEVFVRQSHLYVRTETRGLQVYDYSNPRAPVFVGRFAPYDDRRPAVIAVDGDRLYFGGESLQVFDLGNPAAPLEIGDYLIGSGKMAVDQGIVLASRDKYSELCVYDLRADGEPISLGTLDFSRGSSMGLLPYHGTFAMQWPNIAVQVYWWVFYWNGWTYLPLLRQSVSNYTLGGAQTWNRVQNDHALGDIMAVGPDALYEVSGSSLIVRTLDNLDRVRSLPGPCAQLLTERTRLYGMEEKRVWVYDISAPLDPALAGKWAIPPGQIVAQEGDCAYLLGKGRDLVTVDISNPTAPLPVGNRPTLADPRAAKIAGSHLYVADGAAGLRIFSLTDPEAPVEVGRAQPAGVAQDVDVIGTMAYVADSEALVRLYDVSSPTSPALSGVLVEDASYRNAYAISAQGDHAYVLALRDDGRARRLLVVDIRHPEFPWVVGTHASNGGDLAVSGDALLVLNVRQEMNNEPGPVYDVSDPTSLARIGEFAFGESVTVENDWAFVAGGPEGLRAWSIADPTSVWDGGVVQANYTGVAAAGRLVYAVSETAGLATFEFHPPSPVNLVPQDFELAIAAAAPGQPIEFSGGVLNSGPAATDGLFWITFAGVPLDRDGGAELLCDSLPVLPGLDAGASVTLSGLNRTLYGPDRRVFPGRYMVGLVVDDPSLIAERRENDNILWAAQELVVWPSANDLRPVEIDYSPTDVAGGQTLMLSGEIEYTGLETTQAGFWVEFRVSSNADFTPPRHLLCDSLFVPAGLAPGATYPFSIRREVLAPPVGPPRGLYVVGAIVDPIDELPEKDETNNTFWRASQRLFIDRRTDARRWEIYR